MEVIEVGLVSGILGTLGPQQSLYVFDILADLQPLLKHHGGEMAGLVAFGSTHWETWERSSGSECFGGGNDDVADLFGEHVVLETCWQSFLLELVFSQKAIPKSNQYG